MTATITAYDWAPDEGRGLVRDMRVRWALEEVGQRYDVRLLSWGEQKGSAHRARNPFGQVPAYEDDGLVLFESGAIVLHIADNHPGLFAEDPAARARAIGWMFAALNTVEPVVWDLVMVKVIERDQDWSKARLPGVLTRLHERLDELSARLGDAEWLDGPFSAGDLLMVAVLRNLSGSGIVEAYPNLAAYIARGEARPAFVRALKALRADLTGKAPAGWPSSAKTART
ncbi:putative glutathione S-transferase [Sphingomonas changbaiensis NBRC 104936]|uniref:Putative glutathione S-transferase n=1 Tax=Sphingomonas changbaiensis NBRC 104936 TaxID=1219043 RepID=A0A0E9MSD0_9SPHN|nr:glutathione S-transferase family protein [Sphingomonas changbaiensis]GAO40464.1 putative glutathione S-transferase [Sphingomonas changbaiensis NBRC 104936]